MIDKNITINGQDQICWGITVFKCKLPYRPRHAGTTATRRWSHHQDGSAGDQQGGGGILNDHAILTINSCAVQNNSGEYGGGIYNDGREAVRR